MIFFLYKFLLVAAIMAVLDYIWLAKLATSFYLKHLGPIALVENGAFKPVLWAAVVVYFCLTLGVTLFCLPLAKSLGSAILYGAAFGFVAYGIYDMTNMALIKGWSVQVSIVDMCWGTFLCATTAGLAHAISAKLGWL